MSLSKPYIRISRPLRNVNNLYMLDSRYCQERASLCKSYRIIQNDLERLFEYIEPCDANKNAYSHRTFELLLRTATEFEANCKGVLSANGFRNARDIRDYYKLKQATKLEEYKVRLQYWQPNPLEFYPFEEWRNSHSLSWYQSYNDVKHNRHDKFHESSLDTLIKAVGGLFCVLYSQFEIQCANIYRPLDFISEDDNNMIGLEGIIFDIKGPVWSEPESYNFNWASLQQTSNPYQQFNFT